MKRLTVCLLVMLPLTAVGTILDDDAPPSPGWRVYLPAIWKP